MKAASPTVCNCGLKLHFLVSYRYVFKTLVFFRVTSDLDVEQQLSGVAKRLFDLPLRHIGNKSKNGTLSSVKTDFDDSHINWGLIITLLIFASSFAVKVVEKDCPEKVDDVILWLTKFIDTELSFWLAKQGGWVSYLFKTKIHTLRFNIAFSVLIYTT